MSGGNCQKHFLDPGTKKPRRFLGGAASFVWVVSELGRSVLIGQQGAVIARAKPLVAKGRMIQRRQFRYEHVLLVQQFFDRVKQAVGGPTLIRRVVGYGCWLFGPHFATEHDFGPWRWNHLERNFPLGCRWRALQSTGK